VSPTLWEIFHFVRTQEEKTKQSSDVELMVVGFMGNEHLLLNNLGESILLSKWCFKEFQRHCLNY
jgi:hypothetical protein